MNELDLLGLLREAISAGRVTVELDYGRLTHMDSPICVESERNRWVYGIMAVTMGAGIGLAWHAGVVALALGVALYITLGRGRIRQRMAARFHAAALEDVATFKKLWRLRGVTLALVSRATMCRSPDGDWRRFVLVNLAPQPQD